MVNPFGNQCSSFPVALNVLKDVPGSPVVKTSPSSTGEGIDRESRAHISHGQKAKT